MMAGTPVTAVVCQKVLPLVSAAFSAVDSSSVLIVAPFVGGPH